MSEFEQGNTDVNNTDGATTQESAESSSASQDVGNQQAAGTEVKEEKHVPYSRFQELVAQKNEYMQQTQSISQKMQEMERALSQLQSQNQQQQRAQPNKQVDPMIERLRGIDPDFAHYLDSRNQTIEKLQSQLQDVAQWRENSQGEQLQAQANKSLDDLYTKNSVLDRDKSMYRSLIEAEVSRRELSGEILGVQHLPSIFDSVHKNMTGYTRNLLSEYANAKKQDAAPSNASAPSQAKPAVSEKPMSIDELKNDFAKLVREGNKLI